MKDLMREIGRSCENHVEKVTLMVVAIICAWLFFTRVVFSPNAVAIDRTGLAYAPGQIDRQIYEEKAQTLRTKLRQRKESAAARTYARRFDGPICADDAVIAGVIDRPLPQGFIGLFESPLGFLGALGLRPPRSVSPEQFYTERKYRLPRIPEVTDVRANHIRAVAYVPLQEVTPEVTYDRVAVEPNDIDLVTVAGRFDVAQLYRRFQASFNGVDVLKDQWRDPCLAKPVFAAVQLERQERHEDGSWGAWRAVLRSRVEAHRELFRVYERVEDLPLGGLELRKILFDREEVAMELLQPEPYRIASAEEDWFPPSYYAQFKDVQQKVAWEKKRAERERDRRQDSPAGADLRGELPSRGDLSGMYAPTQAGRRQGWLQGQVPRNPVGVPPEVEVRRDWTTNGVYRDFGEELIAYGDDLSRRDEPLLLWAFDDTAAPGRTYRYRLRVGVFNPVAGTDQLADQDLSQKDQVILWSPYSEVTEPIEIRQRVYLFAKGVQSQTKTALVEVARYALGYWRSEHFLVRLGEEIGAEKELAHSDREQNRNLAAPGVGYGYAPGLSGVPDYAPSTAAPQNAPAVANYRTGKVLIDLVQVRDWGNASNLRPRVYYDMLYTGDGTRIEHMPVNAANWPAHLAATYQHIRTQERKEPQPFRAFGKSGWWGRGGREDYGESGLYEDTSYEGGGLYY
jgi:hypothetical protein